MSSQPSTPPRRVHSASGQHLHKRSVSINPTSLHFSPPSNRSSPSYRLMHDSPKRPRIRLADSVALAGDGRRTKDGFVRRNRWPLWIVLAIGLVMLAERSWNGQGSVLSRGSDRRIDELDGFRVVEKVRQSSTNEETQPQQAQNQDKVVLDSERQPTKPEASDRWVRIARPGVRPPSEVSTPAVLEPPPIDPAQKFIFVAWMGEQETKAQAHLYQLGLLALATNRTLVLPGVRKSRFGSCYLDNDFSLYYAADTFDRFGIPYMTASNFSSWIKRREQAPTAQMISFVRGPVVPQDRLDATPEHFCIDRWRLDWTRSDPRAFFIPTTDWKSPEVRARYGEQVVSSLIDSASDPSVLVVQYNLRFPFLTPELIASLSPFHFTAPQQYSYFPYSRHWLDLGHSIAEQVSPAVGVHWRIETLDVARIASCGVALVHELREIRKKNPAIRTLYLATDYPLDLIRDGAQVPRKNVVANSGTLSKTLTPAHHAAMRSFLSLLEDDTGDNDDSFHLTTFLDESRLVRLPADLEALLPTGSSGVESLDGAIAGLVDKVVLSNVELFYAGLPISDDKQSGCAKLSQFTTQIISGRKATLARSASEDEETRLSNDVGHFSLLSAGA